MRVIRNHGAYGVKQKEKGKKPMICKIDGGMLEHLGQEGYTDRWKCRRCRVVWQLEPRGDVDTKGRVVAEIMKKKLEEMEGLRNEKVL